MTIQPVLRVTIFHSDDCDGFPSLRRSHSMCGIDEDMTPSHVETASMATRFTLYPLLAVQKAALLSEIQPTVVVIRASDASPKTTAEAAECSCYTPNLGS
jgi:hypothetical protein